MLLVVLTACSVTQYRSTGERVVTVTEDKQGAELWLADLHSTRDMDPEQQQQMLQYWEQQFGLDPGANNRMRLILLLSTGDDTVRDRKRAHRLLKDVDTTAFSDTDIELIAIMQQLLNEQRDSKRLNTILWKQLTAQDRRIEELEQQLQALTTIEQTIQQREKPAVIEDGQ